MIKAWHVNLHQSQIPTRRQIAFELALSARWNSNTFFCLVSRNWLSICLASPLADCLGKHWGRIFLLCPFSFPRPTIYISHFGWSLCLSFPVYSIPLLEVSCTPSKLFHLSLANSLTGQNCRLGLHTHFMSRTCLRHTHSTFGISQPPRQYLQSSFPTLSHVQLPGWHSSCFSAHVNFTSPKQISDFHALSV